MKTNLSLIRNKHFEILKGYRTARTRKPLNNKHDQEQMEEKLIIIEKKNVPNSNFMQFSTQKMT